MEDRVTPEMLRAAQLNTELGSYACSELAGGYDLLRELYNIMRVEEKEGRYVHSGWFMWDNTCKEDSMFYVDGVKCPVNSEEDQLARGGDYQGHIWSAEKVYTKQEVSNER